LGEIFIDVPLPVTEPETAHCGSCQACKDVCPTQAIVGDRRVDARRCISYLTIEHDGPLPVEMRPLLGNRVYGCDDCQLVCPWNKFAQRATLPDFDTRKALDAPSLLNLWAWDEPTFLRLTEGSPIRRIGHERWQRNIAVAMGNALAGRLSQVLNPVEAQAMTHALQTRLAGAEGCSDLLKEHIQWALDQAH
jgi:epoxyqueuosine reductase